VIAVLGILAAIVIPNASAFMLTGTLNAANTEASSVKTAALGYYNDNQAWPADSKTAGFGDYCDGTVKAVYTFDTDGSIIGAGMIIEAGTDPDDWGDGILWDETKQLWIKAS